jgi:hypothetical protein
MAVHWWRTDRLVEELAADRVTEQESLWYAMISAVLYFETMYYANWFGGYRTATLLLESVVVTAIGLVGLKECFKSNGGAAGAHFLKRLYCLGTPVGIKIALVSIVLGQINYFLFPRLVTQTEFRDPLFVFQLMSLFVAGMFTVLFYWSIAAHMARINDLQRSNSGVQPTPASRRA